MSWHYQLIKKVCPKSGEEYLEFHEVYDDNNSWAEKPETVSGSDIDEILWILDKMKEAVTKYGVLTMDDLGTKYEENPWDDDE